MAKLGERSQITIGTSNLKHSYEFYLALGFRTVAKGHDEFDWVKLTDDSILLLLLENGSNYLGFSYFTNDIASVFNNLEKQNIRIIQDLPKEKVFFSPEDLIFTVAESQKVNNYLIDYHTYLTLPQESFKRKDALPNHILGAFGEMACHCSDVDESIPFYENLGFEVKHRAKEPYDWALLSDGLNIIGLHNTLDFSDNNITYFSPDVKDTVITLKELGIGNITEFTGTGGDENNVVIGTPENQHLFFFNS